MAEVKKENWFTRTWNKTKKFFRELRSELKKIVWPTWSQVLKNTAIVAVCVLVVGVFVWVFDIGAKYLVQLILSIGG